MKSRIFAAFLVLFAMLAGPVIATAQSRDGASYQNVQYRGDADGRSYRGDRDRGGYDRGYYGGGYNRGYRDGYDHDRHAGRAVAIIGGGAAAGAAIGAVTGGGKGAAVGALVGGVSGLIINQATRHHRH